MKRKKPTIFFMGTYPPRKCGIATFTRNLAKNFEKNTSGNYRMRIIAMDDNLSEGLKYPREVKYRIRERNIDDYIRISRKLNKDKSVKLVCIQHEYGIFGGKYLNFLSAFLESIRKPVVMTLHSVVPNPPDNLKSMINYYSKKISGFVVMANKAIEILRNDYDVECDIHMIPHGIHECPYEPNGDMKKKLGYEDHLLLGSFGLISGGKNYEDIIGAMPGVVKKYPNALFLIMGQTHPGILRDEGEKYRERLMKMIHRLKLDDNVKFVNKYMKPRELMNHLSALDIFVSSGRGTHQITSGTLSYAQGCGRPVVTIPFLHAQEAVTKERGILAEIGKPKSFERAIKKILSDKNMRESMGRNAYEYSRAATWPNVSEAYTNVFNDAISRAKN